MRGYRDRRITRDRRAASAAAGAATVPDAEQEPASARLPRRRRARGGATPSPRLNFSVLRRTGDRSARACSRVKPPPPRRRRAALRRGCGSFPEHQRAEDSADGRKRAAEDEHEDQHTQPAHDEEGKSARGALIEAAPERVL